MSLLLRMAGADLGTDAGRAMDESLRAGAPAPEVLALLSAGAERFLRAGGVWTPEAWCILTRVEQAAAEEAGRRRDTERALASALAARGPLEMAELAVPLDGGAAKDALDAAAVEAAVDRLMARAHAVLETGASR